MRTIQISSILFCLFMGTLSANAQELPTIVPLSPDMGSLSKFTEVPVSHYTGIPNINIPITVLKGRSIEVPVSLSYHAGGHKVEEIASWAGLGWNLNVGGQISRVVRQMGDDNEHGYLFSDVMVTDLAGMTNVELNTTLSSAATLNRPDFAPDEFNFSFMGYSGKFYFNQNRSPNNPYGELVQFPKSDLKIEPIFSGYTIEQWKVTTPDGTEYLFGGTDAYDIAVSSIGYTSDTQSLPQPTSTTPTLQNNITSWKLISIKSITNDIITFDYEPVNYDVCSSSQETYALPSGLQFSQSQSNGTNSMIKEISAANGTITFNRELTKREDLNYDYALDNIVIKDNDGNLINQVDLIHSYFQSALPSQIYFLCDGSSAPTDNNIDNPFNREISKRLKLDEVRFLGNQVAPTENYNYKLEYNTATLLPHRLSKSQDYWGYYNGESNAYLIPSMPYKYLLGFNQYNGANRKVNPGKAQANMLTKMIYPEGGYTTFEYENNAVDETFNYPSSNVVLEPTINKSASLNSRFQSVLNCNNNQVIYKDFTVGGDIEEVVIANSSSTVYENGNTNLPVAGEEIYFRIKKYDPQNGQLILIDSETGVNFFPIGSNTSFGLQPGNYRLEIEIDIPQGVCPENEDIKVDLEWGERVFNDKKLVGGLRIKSITNFDNNDLQAAKRSYSYKNDDGKESGWIASVPVFKHELSEQGVGVYEKLFSNHYIPFVTTQSNNVGYTQVIEIIEGDINEVNSNQKNTYKYSYLGIRSSFPGAPTYEDWINGNLIKNSSFETDFANSTPSSQAYKVKREQSKGYNYIFGTNSGNLFTVTSDMTLGFDVHFRPIGLIGNSTAGIVGQIYSLINGATLMNNSVDKELFYKQNNDTTAHVRETRYTYKNLYPHLNPILVKVKNSEGKETQTKYYYPDDVLNNNSLGGMPLTIQEFNTINQLKENNRYRISQPIQTETTITKNETELSKATQRTIFKDWGNDIVLPEKIQTQKGTTILETRIEYHNYDNLGNPLEVSRADGAHIVYLWGYNQQYPIAKIENATFAEVAVALGVSESTLKTFNETHLSQLNGLRTGLPKAMISTYTYNPLVGVTSMTDPRGYTMSYEYDEFNRLKQVKDADGFILSENTYHYKGQ